MNGMLDLSLLALLKAEKARWPRPCSGWKAAWRKLARWFR
jgi:hypothetical protein